MLDCEPQVALVYKALKMQMNSSPDVWDEEYVAKYARKMDKAFDGDEGKHKKWWSQCDNETIIIPGGSGQDMEVLIYKKKGSVPERPLMVYAHGGGGNFQHGIGGCIEAAGLHINDHGQEAAEPVANTVG